DPYTTKPHAVCVPLPAQGHINPMLKLAKLLHHKGFRITFVHTQFNRQRLEKSLGEDALRGLADFRFEVISDGLPPSNPRGILDLPSLCLTLPVDGLRSFRELVMKLMNSDAPPPTCIVSDGVMSFTLKVAREFGVPEVMFFTPSGCGMLGYLHFDELVERGLFPLKDESCLSNGFLDTVVDCIPAMEGIRLRDLPTFIRTADPDDIMVNFNSVSVNKALEADGVILNTFDDLEGEVVEAIKAKYPELYTLGPLPMLHQQLLPSPNPLDSIQSSLWEEHGGCLGWLDGREPESVLYVNFGSLITVTREELSEFAWGLANSKRPFLWVIRPNVVDGGEDVISEEFMEEIRDRGLIVGWCAQEKVLGHSSIGGFLTHCGWNSTLESMCEGVPLICWPFFAEQHTNCLYSCARWGIGLEMVDGGCGDLKRETVEGVVRELMEGEKGRETRETAKEWKKRGEAATAPGGSSRANLERLVNKLRGLS
ncbi:Glycosyltransferase, partial [Psidium guajava]